MKNIRWLSILSTILESHLWQNCDIFEINLHFTCLLEKLLYFHGKFVNTVFPPHKITPILVTSGYFFSISLVWNIAAATEAPAEASITIFILSATSFIALSMSSLVTVTTLSSIKSQRIGKVKWPVWKMKQFEIRSLDLGECTNFEMYLLVGS